MSRVTIPAVSLVPGQAEGPVLALGEPLSFWGGLDAATGRIIDRRHPQCGFTLGGTILLMPSGRGSSSGSSVLAEALRLGTGPSAIVLHRRDGIVAVGAMVAAELYGCSCPVVVLEGVREWSAIAPAARLAIVASEGDGSVMIV